jgi:transposase-like protein
MPPYVKVKGQDRYLYRAIDKDGATVEFLLTAKRDREAARRFLEKSTQQNGVPTLINIDKSGANKAGIDAYNEAADAVSPIEVRQCKYLNNDLEQDHRNIKRRVRPMLGFKSFWSARIVLGGIELIHMLRKGQLAPSSSAATPLSAADAFYKLAA